MHRTEEILRHFVLAITDEKDAFAVAKEQFKVALAAAGVDVNNRVASNEKAIPNPAVIQAERREGKVRVPLERKTAEYLLHRLNLPPEFTALTIPEFTVHLEYHLHNILLVSIWTNFETYLQGALLEFYHKHPEQMKSDRQVTYDEVVDHRHDIITYLIDREIADFGRYGFVDMIKYIRNRVHYDWQATRVKELDDIYFLRNVIAHNSGVIRSSQQSLVPPQVPVVENQLRISIDYLQQCASTVRSAVDEIHYYVQGKWFEEGPSTSEVPPAG